MKRINLIILLSAFFLQIQAQQTVWLNNGIKLSIVDYKIEPDSLNFFYKTQKGKIKSVELSEVYSCQKTEGSAIVFYKQDTTDHFFSVQEMKQYIDGQYDARIGYKCRGLVITSFALGVATPVFIQAAGMNPIFSPLMPLSETAVVGFTTPKLEKYEANYPQLQDDIYRKGFTDEATQKRINRTAISGTIGMVLGLITVIAVSK